MVGIDRGSNRRLQLRGAHVADLRRHRGDVVYSNGGELSGFIES